MNRLEQMRVFVRVAECSSFSAAAREFGLTQPTVSRAVRQLEGSVGVQLLSRTTRSVVLTGPGERYLERVRIALVALEQAREAALDEQSTPVGRLRVTAPVGFGQARVAPILMDWVCAWEGARTELVLSDRRVDLVAEGFDLAVRIGELESSTLRAVRLGVEPRVVVCTPEFLARNPVGRPQELESLPTVGFGSLRKPWSVTWSRGDDRVSVALSGPMTVNHLPTVRLGVLRGMGLCVVPAWLVREDLDEGRLVRLLADWSTDGHVVHALIPPGRHTPRRVRLFIQSLRDGLQLGQG